MIEILLNQKPLQLAIDTSVAQALQHIDAIPPYAVALNLKFVPRSAYADTYLQAGDQLEVVQPITGG